MRWRMPFGQMVTNEEMRQERMSAAGFLVPLDYANFALGWRGVMGGVIVVRHAWNDG
jgi:hypothetical protein